MSDESQPTLPASAPRKRRKASAGLQRGRMIGRYVVLDKLGAGGMGVVVAAYDPELDRKVAIKVLHAHADPRVDEGHQRLLAEAQALARLSDPNVVAVHDVGTHEGRVFVAMEFVEGQTLERWLARERRAWGHVLDVMIAAGRGLAAAHARELVHRDFKPGNVMIGSDGRVRVMDFGLAFASGEPFVAEASTDRSLRPHEAALGRSITKQGSLLGTPGYMAPEQVAGEQTGPAADQFAFCVSLWEGLYGQPPFGQEAIPELLTRVLEGRLDEPPRSARVPRWLRRVVERGLAVAPERRWPSMSALLVALERGRSRNRSRGLSALALVTAAVALVLVTADHAPPCDGAEVKLNGVWDASTRAAMGTAFAEAHVPYAEDARSSAERTLDAYAARWVELHAQICEATRVRGDQSELLMDQRIGCLDDELRALTALTTMLAHADAGVVENAVQAARSLDPPDECATLERDDAIHSAPPDPALAAAVDAVREQTSKARVLELAGQYDAGIAEAEPAIRAARDSGYDPVIAEAAVALGDVLMQQASPRTRETYEEALHAALASGHGRVEAQALIGLVYVWGTLLGDTETALRYDRQAMAVLRRLGDPPELVAMAALRRGTVEMYAGRLDAAIETFQFVIRVTDGIPNAERSHLAALNNLAAVYGQQGHHREAAEVLVRAAELTEARLGPWHPTVGLIQANLGSTYTALGEPEVGMTHIRRALEIYGKALRLDHPDFGRVYHNLGVVQSALGDVEAAHASWEQALRIKLAALGPDHVSVAATANNICDALIRLGRPAEAIEHCERALAIWTKAHGDSSPALALPCLTLGQAYLALAEPAKAEPYLRRGLALTEVVGSERDDRDGVPRKLSTLEPLELAKARFLAARAIWAAGGDRKEALALAEQAKHGYEASERPSSEELAAVQAWLADPH
jgi:tetratricopeptide (TPR) repeat protein